MFYEIYSGVWMYTENTDFFKSYVQKESSLFTFQAHMDYTFKHGKYLALNGGYADGGETSLNGMEQMMRTETGDWALLFLLPFLTIISRSKRWSIPESKQRPDRIIRRLPLFINIAGINVRQKHIL